VHAHAFVGIGSNQGDRLGAISRALHALENESGVRVLRVSHVYESEPWGVTEQPRFANAVALVDFDGEADALLAVLQGIEERLGRVREKRYGPRTIDLDVLLFGDEQWDSPRLTVPHPKLVERDFVVTPLLEIAPDATLPDGTPLDPRRAVEGQVVGVLGAVPGFEGLSGPPEREVEVEAPVPPAPTQEEAVGEWVAVGPTRFERNAPNSSTDFDLLFYENVLTEAGIPCAFYPHRPNEGFSTYWGISQPRDGSSTASGRLRRSTKG
jgi:2-amino-4-hydroxy-6-hydroxymethyldihydropteridine diphosphokinase